MTHARVDRVHRDRVGAREFLDQAQLFLGDADTEGLSAEARNVLLHTATVCACDAILQAAGMRVTPGDGAHVLRIETALDELGGDTEELFESLDASRERRNEASYAAWPIAHASVIDAREATGELIELARAFLSD